MSRRDIYFVRNIFFQTILLIYIYSFFNTKIIAHLYIYSVYNGPFGLVLILGKNVCYKENPL